MNGSLRISVFLAALVAALAAPVASALAQTVRVQNIDAAAFTARQFSTHNGGASPVCGTAVPSQLGEELAGLLYQGGGSFIAEQQFSQGASITSFRYFVRDFTDPGDSHAYLLRKRLGNGINAFTGLTVMAEAHSSGFDDDMRRFTDNSINGATIDNTKYAYFVEIVNCDTTIEPAGVQIEITTP